MNMVIHDMQGTLEIGDTMRAPKFKDGNRLQKFDLVTANPMWNQDAFTLKDYENDEYDRFKAGYPNPSSADWAWAQHMLASLRDDGKAAIVLDTGAASRGSGNAGNNKEKEIRKWFIEKDLIEGVLYLPENLFYNTTAPAIVLFLDKNKPRSRQGKMLLVNASLAFEKGAPKNFIPEEYQKKIVETFLKWREVEKFSKVVAAKEIIHDDYNISPSRFIHTANAEEHRPLNEIIEELRELDKQEDSLNLELNQIFNKVRR